MIIRQEENGLLFITQPAHAWLAGKLAALWGNDSFDKPTPFEAVVLATRLHDIGWLDWDAFPRLAEDGRPVNFLNTNLEETIPVWRKAVRHVSLMDPFAAMLVSRHASTIYQLRLGREVDPEIQAETKTMLDEQNGIRETIGKGLARHPLYSPFLGRLEVIYRWLRICDLFSLALCVAFLPESGTIDEVPGNERAEFRTIHYSRPKPFELHLEPSPFSEPIIKLSLQTRFVDATTFADQQSYQAALEQAPIRPQEVTVFAS